MSPTPEHVKAREWRERLNLTPKQLADLSGYSVPSIWWFERGLTPPRNKKHMAGEARTPRERQIRWFIWQRYKMVCSAVEAQIKSQRKFDW
jgi:hypothetical protein